MCQRLLRDARFQLSLLELDRRIAEDVRVGGCLICGGRLHQGHYKRQSRGGLEGAGRDLDPDFDKRFSFCCGRKGCRKRALPPSVRFLGRKLYLAAFVTVVCVLVHGLSGSRARRLRESVGVHRRTLSMWVGWWRETFAGSAFWRAGRGRLREPVRDDELPGSLLERFPGAPEDQLRSFLLFIAPMTTPCRWGRSLSPRGGGGTQRMRGAPPT